MLLTPLICITVPKLWGQTVWNFSTCWFDETKKRNWTLCPVQPVLVWFQRNYMRLQPGRCWGWSWISTTESCRRMEWESLGEEMMALLSPGIWKGCRHLTLHRTLQPPNSTFTHIISVPFYRWEGWSLRVFLDLSRKKKKITGNKWLRSQSQSSDPSLCHTHPWPGVQSQQWSQEGLRKFRKEQIRRWQTNRDKNCKACHAPEQGPELGKQTRWEEQAPFS